jgi:ATP-dependent Clp protease ATP-binding subunit ClpC
MFERYTEKARRVIFFARYEASELRSSAIEADHILLGVIREDKPLITRFSKVIPSPFDSIQERIRATTGTGEKLSASVDLPLSIEAKRVLSYAADESDRLNHTHIGTEHLLLGLLRTEHTVAAQVLADLGIDLEVVRQELRDIKTGTTGISSVAPVEEMRRLAADARSLAKAILRKAERIEEICEQLGGTSYCKEDSND